MKKPYEKALTPEERAAMPDEEIDDADIPELDDRFLATARLVAPVERSSRPLSGSGDLQTLGVVPRLFPDVVAGRKTSTIRWREGPVAPGPLRYVCDGDPARTVIVIVTRVTSMPLRAAAAFLGRQHEWPDAVMLEGMREHYPAITLDDVVEIVEHLPPQETAARGRGDIDC